VQTTDCLILDVRMPGMTGPGLQRDLRSKNADLPIVFITAYGQLVRVGRKASGRQRLWFLGHFVPGQKRSALSGHQGPIAAKFSIAAKQQLW
jgi:CheY-like chemotaxis protein